MKKWILFALLLSGCSTKSFDNRGLWNDNAAIGDGGISLIQEKDGSIIAVYTVFEHGNNKKTRFGVRTWRGNLTEDPE